MVLYLGNHELFDEGIGIVDDRFISLLALVIGNSRRKPQRAEILTSVSWQKSKGVNLSPFSLIGSILSLCRLGPRPVFYSKKTVVYLKHF